MAQIFSSKGELLEDFMDEILVLCPECQNKAHIVLQDRSRPYSASRYMENRNFDCTSCGVSKKWELGKAKNKAVKLDGTKDPFFGFALFLQAPCKGEVLWVYNLRHLEYLKNYIGATQRKRVKVSDDIDGSSWRNASIASRLPQWMQLAKNRPEILSAIKKIENLVRTRSI
jgi:hypothetical protein